MSQPLLEKRASTSAYLILAGPFLAIGILFLAGEFRDPGESNIMQGFWICLVIALAWTVWLSGFRVVISEDTITYRDGFFKVRHLPLAEVLDVEICSVSWRRLPHSFQVPRLRVVPAESEAEEILINPKPFPRGLKREILDCLSKSPS